MLQDFRLKVFLKVASEKSFTRAAEALGVTQPAVSQNVSELEKSLGVRLFHRLRGEAVLTAEGEVFVAYANKILSAASETELLFSPLDMSEIRFCVSEEIYSDFILPSLAGFIYIHPEISIIRSSADECDLRVSVKPSVIGVKTSLELDYKPTQAFAFTKTCAVLKNILGF
ncbi:MAG: LysR family transcriptional regulator [Bacteroidales bacterium]|nr:LysR family transcriptional regulator [Bacteroidales bacterium]